MAGYNQGSRKDMILTILNILMRAEKPLTTEQIVYRTDCDRKVVYRAINRLEIAGFPIEVSRVGKQNAYRWSGKVVGF